MLTVAFGESTISRTQVQLWYNRLKEGREDVNDDGRPGRPRKKNCSKILQFWAKTRSHGHRSGRRSTTIQICSKRSKLLSNHGCMVKTLKPKPNHPHGSVQKITYIHNWPLQPFSQDCGVASHNTHVVCVNFIHDWRDLQFTVDFGR